MRWLEALAPPEILAPRAREMAAYRLFVPDNVGDRVAKSWSAGRDGELASYRTEKTVCALQLPDGHAAVHYVFRDADGIDAHLGEVRTAARSLTHLGWGIDQVAGDAQVNEVPMEGEHWRPALAGRRVLRCAVVGTFDDLERKHQQFLDRLDGGTFRPVAPLISFSTQAYALATDSPIRPVIAFRLLDPESGRPLWLDAGRRTRDVAAWLRHAVDEASIGWPFGSNSLIVHGHAPDGGPLSAADGYHDRFSYLPLPSITPAGTESIARGMIVGAVGLAPHLDWVRARLAGVEVSWGGKPRALLEPLPAGDGVLRGYLAASKTWSTVTPVVLPGYHDGSARKAEGLLRKAFRQAGLTPEQVERIEDLEWRDVGFRRGVDRARNYRLPDKVHGPVFHVRVTFEHSHVGPLAIGSGRHRGLGLFAVG
jgi:CRISPR-associated protein Csb2